MQNPVTKKLERLWARFGSKEFRTAYVDSHLSSNIANQIATMREHRGWTQQQLASEAGMKQSQISGLENPSLEGITLKTLKRIAAAFDVAVVIRFVRYSDVLRWSVDPKPENIVARPFAKDSLSVSQPGPLLVMTGNGNSIIVERVTDQNENAIKIGAMLADLSSTNVKAYVEN